MSYRKVEYGEQLLVGDNIRVPRTGHESIISEVVYTRNSVFKTYRIDPKDPNDCGGHWFFAHYLEVDEKLDPLYSCKCCNGRGFDIPKRK